MTIGIEEAEIELIGKRVRIENEYVTMFREVTNIIDASTAFEDPELKLGAEYNLLYVIEGFAESTSEKHISDILRSLGGNNKETKIKVCIYPNTEITIIKEAYNIHKDNPNIQLGIN